MSFRLTMNPVISCCVKFVFFTLCQQMLGLLKDFNYWLIIKSADDTSWHWPGLDISVGDTYVSTLLWIVDDQIRCALKTNVLQWSQWFRLSDPRWSLNHRDLIYRWQRFTRGRAVSSLTAELWTDRVFYQFMTVHCGTTTLTALVVRFTVRLTYTPVDNSCL